MPSTFTGSGLEKPGSGEQVNTWDDTLNLNFDIIDRLASQAGTISLTGTTHTLTISDGALSDGQYAVMVFAGSPSGTNTVTISPNTAKRLFFARNTSGQTVILTQGSGGNVTIADGDAAIVYCDGAGSGAAVVDITAELSLSANLSSIAGLTFAANKGLYTTGANTAALFDLTAAGRALLDDADAEAQRTTLGLAIGTDVQAYDAALTSIAALGTAANKGIYATAANTFAEFDLTAAGRALLDDADAAAQRTTLGLGSAATLTAGTSANNVVQLDGSGALPAVDGSALTGISSGYTDADARAAQAGHAVGAVGSYAFCERQTATDIAPGATVSGADLEYAWTTSGGGTSPSGTWRLMGDVGASAATQFSLWLRIS